MMTGLVAEIISQFSLRILYLEMLWFATFGYLMHVFVVMALTRLPFLTLLKSIFRLQMTSIAISFVVASVFGAVGVVVSHMLSIQHAVWFVGQQGYVWFVVSMMFVASYVLCQVFVTVPCSRFRTALIATNACVGVLGLLVLKAMNLLVVA